MFPGTLSRISANLSADVSYLKFPLSENIPRLCSERQRSKKDLMFDDPDKHLNPLKTSLESAET